MSNTPNPGSEEAVDQGCTCPVMDNNHGAGAYKGGEGDFIINMTCPLHGMMDEATYICGMCDYTEFIEHGAYGPDEWPDELPCPRCGRSMEPKPSTLP